MLLWFIVVAPIVVAEVFRSPMVDYRLVALGAVLPLIDVIIGWPTVLHTLAGPVVLLTVTMLATVGRRLLRRRLLGVSIGWFLHLVLDGTWASSHLFWWPAFGLSLRSVELPEATGAGFRLLLEVAAVGIALVAWRRYGLDDPAARRRLVRTGHLPAAVRSPGSARNR